MDYAVQPGSIVDSFGHRVDNVDVVLSLNHKPQIIQMFQDAMIIEFVMGIVYVVPVLTVDTLSDYLQKVLSFKKLSTRAVDESSGVRKIPGAILAFESNLSFHQIKDYANNFYETHDVLNHYEADFVSVLNHSIMIKDWHEPSSRYKSLETKQDSLMWFFILYFEYIIGDSLDHLGFNFREYIQEPAEYKEY